jgi:hypothetical protein
MTFTCGQCVHFNLDSDQSPPVWWKPEYGKPAEGKGRCYADLPLYAEERVGNSIVYKGKDATNCEMFRLAKGALRREP